jgi:hypothetical protein
LDFLFLDFFSFDSLRFFSFLLFFPRLRLLDRLFDLDLDLDLDLERCFLRESGLSLGE